jgi:hypothetical protein
LFSLKLASKRLKWPFLRLTRRWLPIGAFLFLLSPCALFFLRRFRAAETPPSPFDVAGYRRLSDFKSYDGASCDPCLFTDRSRRPDSSAADCVIAVMFNMTFNLVPFVRTLRTTGSRCRIVVLADDTALSKLDVNLTMFLESCGVTVVRVWHPAATSNAILLVRNRVLLHFLRLRRSLFKRIVIADLYDTIFQGDPFYRGFDRATVGFSLKTRPCDIQQFLCIEGIIGEETADLLFTQKCVNAGTIVGVPRLVVEFLRAFVAFVDRVGSRLETMILPDQVAINAMVTVRATGPLLRFYGSHQQYNAMPHLQHGERVVLPRRISVAGGRTLPVRRTLV